MALALGTQVRHGDFDIDAASLYADAAPMRRHAP